MQFPCGVGVDGFFPGLATADCLGTPLYVDGRADQLLQPQMPTVPIGQWTDAPAPGQYGVGRFYLGRMHVWIEATNNPGNALVYGV